MKVFTVVPCQGLNFLETHIPAPPSRKFLRDAADDLKHLRGLFYCIANVDNKPLQKLIERRGFSPAFQIGNLKAYSRHV